MKTTLNLIRARSPCTSGWETLLRHLGKTKADDEPVSITTILDSNGLNDAIWCLRAVQGHDKEIRLFAVWCARQVEHLMADERSKNALDVAERYANGEATVGDLGSARAAAAAAADAAADAAYAARADAAAAAADAARADAAAAAYAAADAADAAAYAAADAAAADDAAEEKQAARLREICAQVEEGV